jgi:hypothetical protein
MPTVECSKVNKIRWRKKKGGRMEGSEEKLRGG